MNYTDINAKIVDSWVQNGWEWGKPISHEVFEKARNGEWGVYLTPTKTAPHEWFGEMRGKKILGLASGGGQQIPLPPATGSCGRRFPPPRRGAQGMGIGRPPPAFH